MEDSVENLNKVFRSSFAFSFHDSRSKFRKRERISRTTPLCSPTIAHAPRTILR